MNILIVSCQRSKESAQKLSEASGWPYVVLSRNEHPNNESQAILNYGCSWIKQSDYTFPIINKGESIDLVRDKRETFELLRHTSHRTVPYTTSASVAKRWLLQNKPIFIRQQVKGCNGNGLIYCNKMEDFVKGKLYSLQIEGTEHRAYIFRGKLLSIYDKRPLDDSYPIKNWKFVYNKQLTEDSIDDHFFMETPNVLDLDFFAVDFLLTHKERYTYMLEINSAPILFPITIKRLIRGVRNDIPS